MRDMFRVRYDVHVDTESEELPKRILEKQCVYLNKNTKGIVIGRVAAYDGKIDPYEFYYTKRKNVEYGKEEILTEQDPEKAYVQDFLGEVGENRFTYEFFLTSKSTPEYKFRVLFLQYGLAGYPAKLVLEEGIADEISSSEEKYFYLLGNREEYEELLGRILNSERFTDIVTKLIRLNTR